LWPKPAMSRKISMQRDGWWPVMASMVFHSVSCCWSSSLSSRMTLNCGGCQCGMRGGRELARTHLFCLRSPFLLKLGGSVMRDETMLRADFVKKFCHG
jgi:hypothetical protein